MMTLEPVRRKRRRRRMIRLLRISMERTLAGDGS
jgi:hypothetical protein